VTVYCIRPGKNQSAILERRIDIMEAIPVEVEILINAARAEKLLDEGMSMYDAVMALIGDESLV